MSKGNVVMGTGNGLFMPGLIDKKVVENTR